MNQVLAFTSNRLEELYTHLKACLFSDVSTPFTRRLIVVPSPAMKSWLMLQMARDPQMGIAMGLEITYLDQSIESLKHLYDPIKTKSSLRPLELALLIENEIHKLIKSYSSMHKDEQLVWSPLFEYLTIRSKVAINKKVENRITLLSECLAPLFVRYGIYGGAMTALWEKEKPLQWQQQLWLKIFSTASPWNFPYRELTTISNKTPQISDTQIHLFGLSFIPQLYHRFFLNASQYLPIHFYLFSPCQVFWDDILSDKESKKLKKYWEKKGANSNQQCDLELFLRDRNPLLANFGKVGREMSQFFNEENIPLQSDYVLPKSIENQVQYVNSYSDELRLSNTQDSFSLLDAVQADIVLLRNPHSSDKINFPATDQSIQITVANSRKRELEILHDQLLHLIQKHQHDDDPITPHDIVVMTPDISLYAPFITSVFNASEAGLEAQIMDKSIAIQNPFVQAFHNLLNLPFTRWEVSSIMTVFENPFFQKKHKLSQENVLQIHEWIKITDIRWGQNLSHRNEILRNHHCSEPMLENSPAGTWEHAYEQLLESLIFSHSSLRTEITDAALLGKWISILRTLRSDLTHLIDGTKWTLAQWTTYLTVLCEKYFQSSHEDEEHFLELSTILNIFAQAETKLQEAVFSYSSIKHHLQNAFNKPSEMYRENSLHSVCFSSFLPMRAIPKKVIAVLGMDEEAFPRKENANSLDLLKQYDGDYCPSQTEYDRFLFLETILSSRKYLLLSYIGHHPTDGKESSPSLLLSELSSYLDNSYTIEGKAPSQTCIQSHPYHAFDKSYFSKGSKYPSYSRKNYLLAEAYYHHKKLPSQAFISNFQISREPLSATERIQIKDLKAFASNPIKTYFNKTLKIYLEEYEDRVFKADEVFEFNALQRHIIKKDALKSSVDDLLKDAENKSLLPYGLFKNSAVQKMHDEIVKLKSNLSALGIVSDQIFSITFSEMYSEPYCQGSNWLLPPLTCRIGNRNIEITGSLPQVTAKGLISPYNDDEKSLSKLLPELLIFQFAIRKFDLPISRDLLITHSAKAEVKGPFVQEPEELLRHYLEYYFVGLDNISPLIPEWIPSILLDDTEKLESEIQKSLCDPYNKSHNSYLHWSLSGGMLPNGKEIAMHWKPIADKLFKPLFEHWS